MTSRPYKGQAMVSVHPETTMAMEMKCRASSIRIAHVCLFGQPVTVTEYTFASKRMPSKRASHSIFLIDVCTMAKDNYVKV